MKLKCELIPHIYMVRYMKEVINELFYSAIDKASKQIDDANANNNAIVILMR
jgi:hypothetical protein